MSTGKGRLALTVIIIGLLLSFLNGALLLALIIGTWRDKSGLELAVGMGFGIAIVCIVVGNFFFQRSKAGPYSNSRSQPEH
jgi:uncharacterized membrane protein